MATSASELMNRGIRRSSIAAVMGIPHKASAGPNSSSGVSGTGVFGVNQGDLPDPAISSDDDENSSNQEDVYISGKSRHILTALLTIKFC